MLSLKKISPNDITEPFDSITIKLFSNNEDNGRLYYKDGSGIAKAVGAEVIPTFDNVIYSKYSDLYNQRDFATGSYYYITDFKSKYRQPDFYCDGTLKSILSLKKSDFFYPILVLAISNDKLSNIAYQPAFPKDKIEYDFEWNSTEFHVDNEAPKGRITQRIDEYGNKTDYDHRTIEFKRYQNYEKSELLIGTISNYNCISGELIGSGFLGLTSSDIIIIDSKSDIDYDIGLKIVDIIDDNSLNVVVDSLYTNGVPSSVALRSGSTIVPINYSFDNKEYRYYKASQTMKYDQYKEVYFGQGDSNDFDEFLTFQQNSSNNNIGNYSDIYLSGKTNNTIILSNNIFGENCNNNFHNGYVYNNIFGNSCYCNNIIDDFYNNIVDNNMCYNNISCNINDINFTQSSHVYGDYNCNIFKNSGGISRLSYYDETDTLRITDI